MQPVFIRHPIPSQERESGVDRVNYEQSFYLNNKFFLLKEYDHFPNYISVNALGHNRTTRQYIQFLSCYDSAVFHVT